MHSVGFPFVFPLDKLLSLAFYGQRDDHGLRVVVDVAASVDVVPSV